MLGNRNKRKIRIRKKVAGTAARPRLSVFRSLKGMYVQLIDDEASVTLVGVSSKSLEQKKKATKKEQSYALGTKLAQLAKEKGITTVVFDRGGNKFHGRVAQLAQGARDGGLVF